MSFEQWIYRINLEGFGEAFFVLGICLKIAFKWYVYMKLWNQWVFPVITTMTLRQLTQLGVWCSYGHLGLVHMYICAWRDILRQPHMIYLSASRVVKKPLTWKLGGMVSSLLNPPLLFLNDIGDKFAMSIRWDKLIIFFCKKLFSRIHYLQLLI